METFLTVLKVLGYILLFFIAWQVIVRLVRHFWHFPAPAIIEVFLNSRLRAKLQDPRKVVQRSGIKPGMQVLEIGCGGGFFLPYAADAVGEKGKAFGLDIAADMLERCRKYLEKFPEVKDRIELLQKSAYELPFADGSLDVVYLVAALMEIPEPARCLAEVKRVLKPGGVLAVSEFMVDPDYPTRRVTIRCGETAGFKVNSIEGNAWNYTVRFMK
jgi:ubiquinone/menaquinone biosynthesis C-methylase UbiE